MPEPPDATTLAPSTVIFDFDGTLVAGDCLRGYLRFLLARNVLRALAARLFAPLGLLMLCWLPLRPYAISIFLWLATVGRSPAREATLLQEFVRGHRLPSIRVALAALESELARGHRVIVATGALRAVAAGLLERLGLGERVALVASMPRRFLAGSVIGAYCHGANKVRMLHAAGYPGPYLRAYTDSDSDLPLLDSAFTPILVNGASRDRRRGLARYGRKLRIVQWS